MSEGTPEEQGSENRSMLSCLDDGRVVEFGRSIGLGRHPLNDVVIPHPRVSARHAAIEWDDGAWYVRDLGSRNHTLLNGERVRRPRPLGQGDVIQLAGVMQWRVERLNVPCDDLTVVRTDTAGKSFGMVGMQLFLGFVGPAEGALRIVHPLGEWSVRAGARFMLLYALAEARGEWVTDEDLEQQLWGRPGAPEHGPSALHKLINELRELFGKRGIDAWFVQRRVGRSRLALPPDQVHLVDDDDAGGAFRKGTRP